MKQDRGPRLPCCIAVGQHLSIIGMVAIKMWLNIRDALMGKLRPAERDICMTSWVMLDDGYDETEVMQTCDAPV